jgi:MFS family permease
MWIPGTSNATQLVFAPLFGFVSGAAIALTPALVAQISPIREIGVRTGMVVAAGSIGALTGSPIGGALIGEDNGGFLYLQLFAGCVTAAGTLCFIFTRIKLGGFSLSQKI